MKVLPVSTPTNRKSIVHLVDIRIVSETTGKRRDRVFMYDQTMKTLSQGTEPLNGSN